jgi:hypothetical protein
MQIDVSEVHEANADSPISNRCDPGAKVTFRSEEQPSKQSNPMPSTDEVMQMLVNDEHLANARR